MLAALMNPEMDAATYNNMRRSMALYGLGSTIKGDDAGPMMQNMLMLDMTRKKEAQAAEQKRIEAEQRAQGTAFLDNMFVGQNTQQPIPTPKPNSAAGVASDAMAALGKSTFTPGDRESFVKAMMPHARREAARLGIDPRIIVAQAAQETGWGKHAPNNNFFGIKSHGKGGGQSFSTKEYINGQPVTITDSFRQYGGMGDSVRGYADFLLENPRYQDMLNAEGLDAQLAALGRSGYATDPNYASSVGAIARSIGATGNEVPQPRLISRAEVVQALRQPGLTDEEKGFIRAEYRAQQQGGDDRTSLRKNVEWLMSPEGGGYSRTDAVKMAKGGVSVINNLGDEIDQRPIVGDPPKGYQRRYDKTNQTWTDEPIPGSEADVERSSAEQTSSMAEADYQRKFDIVNSNLDKAISSIDTNGRMVAGFGSALAALPETEARNFQATIDTIKANLGFEELQNMRDSSPTGGALGQVTEREIAFLQAIQGNLDTAQSPEQLRDILVEIKTRREQFQRERQAIKGAGSGASDDGYKEVEIQGQKYRVKRVD